MNSKVFKSIQNFNCPGPYPDGLISMCFTLTRRFDHLRYFLKLTKEQSLHLGEANFRLEQLMGAIKTLSSNRRSNWDFSGMMLDIETIYWVSFRIIKCIQKLPEAKRWGGKLDVSRVRNDIVEHFKPDKLKEFSPFCISYSKSGPIYRKNIYGSSNRSVCDHLFDFLKSALEKFPDREEELKTLRRNQRDKSKKN